MHYAEEEIELKKILPKEVVASHIGSTAIKCIWAKPIIDILVEVCGNLSHVSTILQHHGWLKMHETETRISFNKGYTEHGFADKVSHLHLRHVGDNDEIYFRNYLNSHPGIAKAYVSLKLELWKMYEHDRNGYTSAKSEFVKTYTMLGRTVPEAGLEPARTQCPRDFKSLVSTIPPFRHPLFGSKKEVRRGTSSGFVAATEKNSA